MRGYLLTEKRVALWNNLLHSHQGRMLLASLSVGVMAGIGMAFVKLNLGIPGHKAWFWVTPVLLTRLLGRCKVGATAGALAASSTAVCLGGHVAGGLIGLPLITFAGMVWDVVIDRLEVRGMSLAWFIPIAGLLGMGANFLAFAKRLINPAGPGSHTLLGLSGWGFSLTSYLICGLMAGLIAGGLAWRIQRQNRSSSDAG